MPISGPASYPAVIQQFTAHWEQANTALGVDNVVLADGSTVDTLESKGEDLVEKRAEMQAAINEREIARGDVDIKKAAALERLVQFNDKIRAFFPDSKWLNALPAAPALASAQGVFMDPMDDASNLWSRINADPGTATPVTLLGGYDQATFATDLTALQAAYSVLNRADQDLKVARSERNELQDEIYAMLKSYRLALPTFFAKDSPIVESLPRLTPLPGHTPDAVTLTGEWDAAANAASLSWTESTEATLAQYEVRMSPGSNYSTEDESVIANITPGNPLSFATTSGLESPGLTAGFKVYVILTTGNEKGSDAVIITRP